VEGVVAGRVVMIGNAQVWGGFNVPSQLPAPASRLYAHNVANVIMLMTAGGGFAPNFADEIVAGMCVTHRGAVTHERSLEALRHLQDTPAQPAQTPDPEGVRAP
jgi:NAD(P) transhydrogenase subunit alpha